MSDRFTQYLIGLPDPSFFAIVRNYLGAVKTPYNKHSLAQQLREFLAAPETMARIVALIDRTDARILSAVEVLGRPDLPRLERFLGAEVDGRPLREQLHNLLDRLILLREDHGGFAARFELNPLLARMLQEQVVSLALFVSARPAQRRASPPQPWLSVSFLAALRAYLLRGEPLYRANGTLRKRAWHELQERFGTTLGDDDQRLRIAIGAMETLALVSRIEDRVEINHEAWDELATLPLAWTQVLVWAAALTSSTERAFEFATVLRTFLHHPYFRAAVPQAEMPRALQLCDPTLTLPVDSSTIVRLKALDILIAEAGPDPNDQGEETLLVGNELAVVDLPVPTKEAVTVHAALDLTVDPHASLAAGIAVGTVAELRRFDVVPRYELTEQSVSAATRFGIERPVVQVLEELSGRPVPQNVSFMLRRWQDRAAAVRVLRGIVVHARGEEAALLRANQTFADLVAEEPAEGLFVMRSTDPRAVERVLTQLGVHLGAGTTRAAAASGPTEREVPEFRRLFDRYGQPLLPPAITAQSRSTAFAGGQIAPGEPAPVSTTDREVHAAVANADLTEEERREWELRVHNKLVLFPHQVRGGQFGDAATEARGLDYLGKIRVIEQAIREGQVVEVVTRSTTGSPFRLLVHPNELMRGGSDVLLRAVTVEDQRSVRIRVRKISLVRRLRGTLMQR